MLGVILYCKALVIGGLANSTSKYRFCKKVLVDKGLASI